MDTPVDTFREPFTFRNSDAAILRFPYPFAEDTYRLFVNIEPHGTGTGGPAFAATFDVDEHYVDELADSALVLARDPARCQVLPHMMAAEWDTLELLMESLSRDYPQHFALHRDGDRWIWINRLLGLRDSFTFGDTATLPQPFRYVTRQAQGDFNVAIPARWHLVPGWRHADHAIRLVAGFQPGHELA